MLYVNSMLTLMLTLCWSSFQVRIGCRRQRRLRLPDGRVHILPPLPGHQPLSRVLPGHAIGGGADRPSGRGRDLRAAQPTADRHRTPHALQRGGRVDGARRRMHLRPGIRAQRQRVRLPRYLQIPTPQLWIVSNGLTPCYIDSVKPWQVPDPGACCSPTLPAVSPPRSLPPESPSETSCCHSDPQQF